MNGSFLVDRHNPFPFFVVVKLELLTPSLVLAFLFVDGLLVYYVIFLVGINTMVVVATNVAIEGLIAFYTTLRGK